MTITDLSPAGAVRICFDWKSFKQSPFHEDISNSDGSVRACAPLSYEEIFFRVYYNRRCLALNSLTKFKLFRQRSLSSQNKQCQGSISKLKNLPVKIPKFNHGLSPMRSNFQNKARHSRFNPSLSISS